MIGKRARMGKNARGNGESREEALRGQIRELKKELIKKDQRIRQLEKQNRGEPSKAAQEEPEVPSDTCPNCGKGKLTSVEYPKGKGGSTIITTCNTCDHKDRR